MDPRDQAQGPLHEMLLLNPDQMLGLYDQAAQEIVDVARFEGHFEGWEPDRLLWPPSRDPARPLDREGLERRGLLVGTIYERVPRRRDERLKEAYEIYRAATPAYHRANRIYLEVKRRFLEEKAGDERDFLQLYQSLYLDVLANGDLVVLDEGEAALERARITRVPMSHAQAVAEALAKADPGDDPRWSRRYSCAVEGETAEGTLRDLLREVARGVLKYIAAGDFLSARYNTYSNFAWFGISVWKVITDVERLLHDPGDSGSGDPARKRELEAELRRLQAMMVEFLKAHRENPAQLKPTDYWYGHHYTYLTRDMIDLTRRLVRKAGGASTGRPELPPLISGVREGRFVEYPGVGSAGRLPGWRRRARLARWVYHSWKFGRSKRRLARARLDDPARRELAWRNCGIWGEATLRVLGIRVRVTVDPRFREVAEALDLGRRKRKVLFLPTHQSLLDHPILYHVLQSPELLGAMGWERPVPCVILARTRMASAGVRVGSRSLTMFGMSAEEFDRLLETVDGYVTLERSRDAGPTTQRLVQALEEYPGLTYPVGTTVAFDIQSPPLQHALFAMLPQDVVIIPIALRGIHSLWPKCPRGNTDIRPGLVEAVVSPPMPGETTLLPRRRSLRTQLESAALFQAVHLTTLFNPEPSEPDPRARG